jgi:uncharacterized protein (DUF885 family)
MNTSDPEGWGRFDIESTSYHEGIPGHHLQLAIAGELDNVAEFRKWSFIAAYGEGWGLYTERLADEMGLYTTPMDRLGMLSADSMRACRLVVDTGLHAKRWTREQGVQFFVDVNGSNPLEVASEVDRYCSWPGQACGYKVGHSEINRQRQRATTALGPRFDVKAFNDTVVQGGNVPLDVLAKNVDEYVRTAKS